MIFSLDAAISFTIMLLCALVFAGMLNSMSQTAAKQLKSAELEEKALMIADSVVKNYDESNTLFGACITDTDKKRILTNQLSMENLRKVKAQNFGEISVESITVHTKVTNETITLEQSTSRNCITAKRFALINGEKGIIEVKVCNGEE